MACSAPSILSSTPTAFASKPSMASMASPLGLFSQTLAVPKSFSGLGSGSHRHSIRFESAPKSSPRRSFVANASELPLVGNSAPDFEAEAVFDQEFIKVKLSEYIGKKYVIMFFYPLDFTFVCPTEIIAFSDRYLEFEKLNTEVLGVSIDSVFSHLAWAQTDRKSGGLGDLKYPLISDVTKSISKSYGVLIPDQLSRPHGSLVLDGAKDDSTNAVSFAPFLKSPAVNDVFSDYYYVGLNRITVGGKKVKVPSELFATGGDGNGGVIIDSGTTFTYMEPTAFEPLVEAFTEQVKFGRDEAAEERTGLRPCFGLPADGKGVGLPELAFHFKGGAEMRLPVENYFAFVGNSTEAVCLTVVTDGGNGGGVGPSGPSMILGNFQQQNYYVVYDLERDKLGFRRQQSCVGP